MTEAQRVQYANHVWDEFCRKSGRERLCSPLEFSLICYWMNHEVPLRVVLRVIQETDSRPRGLMYFERSVDAAARRWGSGM